MADFVPTNEPKLLVFLENFEVKFIPYAIAAGVPAAQCTALQARIGIYRTDSQTLENDRATMEKRTDNRKTTRTSIVEELRGIGGRIKAAPGGEAAAKDLQVIGSAPAERPEEAPEATVEATPLGTRVDFTNRTRQGVNVYRQIIGQDVRAKFLARDTRSPYIDTEKFAQPVKIAYYVVAVENDEETGPPSATVTITTGG